MPCPTDSCCPHFQGCGFGYRYTRLPHLLKTKPEDANLPSLQSEYPGWASPGNSPVSTICWSLSAVLGFFQTLLLLLDLCLVPDSLPVPFGFHFPDFLPTQGFSVTTPSHSTVPHLLFGPVSLQGSVKRDHTFPTC
jgi:hypothetical protein